MLGPAEDSRANVDIAAYRLSEPQNSPRAYAIRTGHSIRLRLSSAYSRRPIGLLSNGCSATCPFAVKEGKMFMFCASILLLPSQHCNFAPFIARMGVYRARPGLWRNCLCPKVARIAEQKFANR